jgi:hypothetical protein
MKLLDAVMLKLKDDLDILTVITCVVVLLIMQTMRFFSKINISYTKLNKIAIYGLILGIVLPFVDILIDVVSNMTYKSNTDNSIYLNHTNNLLSNSVDKQLDKNIEKILLVTVYFWLISPVLILMGAIYVTYSKRVKILFLKAYMNNEEYVKQAIINLKYFLFIFAAILISFYLYHLDEIIHYLK